uniref:ATP synthase complex subunit 8 n=1 Tax=Petropedetes sp. MVZ 234827 TaxID=1338816 RepID=S4V2A1_9NEOB|nr:ATP synthase F0 subunit 8 [Petropedetes sp. MVZ 234827]
MPQLTPAPWFFILLASWLIFIFFSPNKILSHTSLNNFNQYSKALPSYTWSWPW